IKILPLNADPKTATAIPDRQEVTEDGNVHHLAYSMRLHKKTSEWKLINVTLNGVNRAQSFRSQFSQALSKQGGDIDKVISNWLAEACFSCSRRSSHSPALVVGAAYAGCAAGRIPVRFPPLSFLATSQGQCPESYCYAI